jgi:hypothetical protein
LEKTGLAYNIYEATINIELGRKGFATRGKAEAGRLSYEQGISEALSIFRDAQSTTDPQTIIFVEYTFLSQELQFCLETDKDTFNSLTQAIQSFDDAFFALKTVENKDLYQGAETTYPHNKKFRVNGFPRDAFHFAINSHRTRLQNIIRSPGIDPIEKALLKQRHANFSTAQKSYILKQRTALGGNLFGLQPK